MVVTYGGGSPLILRSISLNGLKDCQVTPFSITEIRKHLDFAAAMKEWGERAINLFGLPRLDTDAVLVPNLPQGAASSGLSPMELRMRGGQRVPIFNGTKCDRIDWAVVETDAGRISLRFDRPYSGH